MKFVPVRQLHRPSLDQARRALAEALQLVVPVELLVLVPAVRHVLADRHQGVQLGSKGPPLAPRGTCPGPRRVTAAWGCDGWHANIHGRLDGRCHEGLRRRKAEGEHLVQGGLESI